MPPKESTIFCSKCQKPLIKRLPNGLWHFMFGKRKSSSKPTVDIYVQGNIKMRCWHGDCDGWNTLNFFPVYDENKENK